MDLRTDDTAPAKHSITSGSAGTGGRPILWALFVLIAVSATVLRFSGIAERELWFDENCTFYIMHHLSDWPEDGPDLQREVAHLPYVVLLHLWTRLTGETVWGMRSFSALVGVLGVFILGWLGTQLGGRRVGIIAAVLATLNPLQVHYSQEARCYTTWLLLVTFCICLLYKASRTLRVRWWVIYVLVAWLTVLTHYFTLVWFFGTASGVLISRDRKRFWRQWSISHLVFAVLLVPVVWWLVIPLSEGGSKPWFRDMWAAYPPLLVVPKSIWAMLPSGGYPDYLGPLSAATEAVSLHCGKIPGHIVRWVPMVVVVGMVLFLVARRRGHEQSDQQNVGRKIAFLSILSAAYLLAASVHSLLIEPTYIVGRYDLAVWPSLVLVVALLVERTAQALSTKNGKQMAVRLALTVALACCSAIVLAGMRAAPVGNDSTERARKIANAVEPGDLVISLGKYRLFMLYEWHRLDFRAEIISFPPQHDHQLCWYDAEAELADPERIEEGVRTVTRLVETELTQGRHVWLLAHGEPAGARWEVDRHLFARLAEMGIDIQPLDESLGLARLVAIER